MIGSNESGVCDVFAIDFSRVRRGTIHDPCLTALSRCSFGIKAMMESLSLFWYPDQESFLVEENANSFVHFMYFWR